MERRRLRIALLLLAAAASCVVAVRARAQGNAGITFTSGPVTKGKVFNFEKITDKMALKVVQNGHIMLKDCRVPEANRVQGDTSFRDTARVLRVTRYAVAWMATGCQMGA